MLYLFLQRFVYLGQMVAFGSITNPVGCAVAYRRRYIKDLFEKYTPIFGDDLTNSEDIFIGFALLNEGYRNIQLTDVYARTVEPEVQRLPRQLYLWSSSFLQCCYYFDNLVRSAPRGVMAKLRGQSPRPPSSDGTKAAAEPSSVPEPSMAPAGALHAREFAFAGVGDAGQVLTGLPSAHEKRSSLVARRVAVAAVGGQATPVEAGGIERRQIAEPYRQPFGVDYTRRFGRPVGWVLLTSAFEKIAFPTTLLIMLVLRAWEPLVITLDRGNSRLRLRARARHARSAVRVPAQGPRGRAAAVRAAPLRWRDDQPFRSRPVDHWQSTLEKMTVRQVSNRCDADRVDAESDHRRSADSGGGAES